MSGPDRGAIRVTRASRSGDRELRAALALASVDGLGPLAYAKIIERYGSAMAAVEAWGRGERPPAFPGVELRDVRPVPRAELRELKERGIRVVHAGGPGYPTRLLHLADPPPILYLAGPLPLPTRRAVAVIGTRKATEYGRRMARDIAGGLARCGVAVVSGMARGIDAEAQRAALDAGGATVGVLGCGLDHVSPPSQAELYRDVRRRGLLASEFHPSEPPRAGLFPRRNRIIAALAEAVVVVQAGLKSGTDITVRHALDLGREVLAVPGPVGPAASLGVHRLLREGCAIAACVDDVLTALGEPSVGEALRSRPGADPAGRIARRLEHGPAHTDELVRASGLSPGDALALLTRMELEGRLESLPGGRFVVPPPPPPPREEMLRRFPGPRPTASPRAEEEA